MRKLLILLFTFGVTTICKSQELIATYNGSSITIISDFTSAEKEQAFDTLMNRYFSLTGCTLDSVVIDDPDPNTVDSSAYAIFYGKCGGVSYAIGLYLKKTLNTQSDLVEFYLDDDSITHQRHWTCTPEENCEIQACKPIRDGFLAPVSACHCKNEREIPCTYVTGGGGISLGDWVAIATFLWNIFRP